MGEFAPTTGSTVAFRCVLDSRADVHLMDGAQFGRFRSRHKARRAVEQARHDRGRGHVPRRERQRDHHRRVHRHPRQRRRVAAPRQAPPRGTHHHPRGCRLRGRGRRPRRVCRVSLLPGPLPDIRAWCVLEQCTWALGLLGSPFFFSSEMSRIWFLPDFFFSF